MDISPIIFFDMAAAILILALCLAAVVFYLSRITKALHVNPDTKDENLQKNTEILDAARIKAVKIVDDANSRALDIINKITLSADIASESFKQNLSLTSSAQIKEFEKVTSDFTSLYSQILKDLKTKNIEVFQNVSKDIENNTMVEIENFKESMQKLTALSQKEVRKKIDTDYESAKREIENYKKGELQKIDAEIYKILERIAKEVLGRALSLSDHEDLIEESIEKAKKEGAFR